MNIEQEAKYLEELNNKTKYLLEENVEQDIFNLILNTTVENFYHFVKILEDNFELNAEQIEILMPKFMDIILQYNIVLFYYGFALENIKYVMENNFSYQILEILKMCIDEAYSDDSTLFTIDYEMNNYVKSELERIFNTLNVEYDESYIDTIIPDTEDKLKLFNLNMQIEKNPTCETYYERAEYKKGSDYEGAIEDYTKAIELNPQFYEAYFQRSNCYGYLEQYDKEIEDLENYLKYKNDSIFDYKLLADAKIKYFEDYLGAIDIYNRAIERNIEGAYIQRALVYIKLKEFEKAEQDINRAITDPDVLLAEVGDAYFEMEQYEKAINYYQGSIVLGHKDELDIFDKLDFRKQNWVELVQSLSATISSVDDFTQCKIAKAYMKLKQYDKAMDILNEVIKNSEYPMETLNMRGQLKI